MTGEITLTGQVLPIGGLKEKALAAQRAGITRVIAPRRNEPDLEDIPEHLRARPRVRLGGRGRARCSTPRSSRDARRRPQRPRVAGSPRARAVPLRARPRVGYLLLTLPLGVVYFAVLIGGLASAVGGAFIIGIPLFVGLMFLWRALARFERRLLRRLLDVEHRGPLPAAPSSATRLGRIRDRAPTRRRGRTSPTCCCCMPMGLVSFTVVVCLAGRRSGCSRSPPGAGRARTASTSASCTVDSVWEGLLVTPLALPVWLLFLLAVRGLVALHGGSRARC